MSLWIFASLCAALAQALRFMLQKSLSLGGISATGATFARFVYSAPIVFVLLCLWLAISDTAVPAMSGRFWLYGATGGLSQILATICVVLLFKERHFAVGITFKKTEVILAAATGFVLLGDAVSVAALAAIVLGVAGVLILSAHEGQKIRLANLGNRSAVLGLAAGLLFAISAVTYRGASLEIDAAPLLRAGVTLSAVTAMQMVAMVVWLAIREPGTMGAVMGAWRRGIFLGITSLLGSYGWFVAFTLQNAAYVKAVGQIELIFVLIIGAVVFGEKVSKRELLGMALLASSIAGLLLAV
ncbi:EamA family transporter [Roseobacteraceae bacterium S113]